MINAPAKTADAPVYPGRNKLVSEVEDFMENDKLGFLLQSLGQVIFQLDNKGNCTSLSNAWKDISGFDVAESIGTSLYSYFDDSLKNEKITFIGVLKGYINTAELQLPLLKKGGQKIWVRLLIKNIKGENGDVKSVFGSLENITDKYTTDLVMKESNEKLNTILNNSKEIILSINLDDNIIENVNDAISILGYTPEDWKGLNYKRWTSYQRQKFHELMKLALKNELKVSNQMITFANKDNTELIPFEFSTSIFTFKNSKYLLCVLRDIRERLEYEKNLHSISNQLTHLISNIDDVYAIYDLKTASFDFVSDNVEHLYQRSKESFAYHGLIWEDLIHVEDVAGITKEIQEIVERKHKGEFFYRITTPAGETKMLLEKITVGKDSNGLSEKLYIVKTDYTHIEHAEQSLIETERKFKFISENISDFISIHDPDWNFTYASPSIRNILGYEPEEILGLGGFDLVHPQDVIRTLDEALEPVVLEKKETRFRYRMKAKNGEFKWVETYSKPVIDAHGQTTSIISSTRDVTDQVNAETRLKTIVTEREKLLVELEQSLTKERELNELRSMFVSTASHQFRTPLTVIQSGVEIMELYLEDLPGEKQKRFQRQFNKIQGEVERLHYLMSDILLLGRANAARTPFQPETADLVIFCKEIIEEKFNNTKEKDRKVLLTVEGNRQPVDFDPKLIGHAIENIINNAYKYSTEGNLCMNLCFEDTEVKIDITDQGIGIPEEDLKNLFQPFYRATNTSEIEGTGLGLAIMKEFVDKHSGEIFVSSILNKGTTISVILPISQKLQ